ncbi:hypothetical protein R3P38DRAFT_2543437, partial [Favolaschia claudopus]
PIVIVLDALDECSEPSRQALISLISEDMATLPPVFRLLVTSRPDPEITKVFQFKAHIAAQRLDIGTEDATKDILLYLRQRMKEIGKDWGVEEAQWPGEHDIQLLATYTGGVFTRAAAACRFVEGFNPAHRLQQLLETGPEWLQTVNC